jgi:hypothetical protein
MTECRRRRRGKWGRYLPQEVTTEAGRPPESVKVRCMHRTPLHGSGCLTQQSRMRSVAVTLYFTAALLKLLKNFLLAVGVARVTTVQLLSDFLQNTALSPLLRMQP